MKLHLPLLLAAAVLALFVSAPVYSAAIPEGYVQMEVDELSDMLNLDSNPRDMGLLLFDSVDYIFNASTATKPFYRGENSLFFTSAPKQSSVNLKFKNGYTKAFFMGQGQDLTFADMKHLLFRSMNDGAISTTGYAADLHSQLTFSGITDEDENTSDVVFEHNNIKGNAGAAIDAVHSDVSFESNGGVRFYDNKVLDGTVSSQNQDQGEEENKDLCGGAINLVSSTLSMKDNQSITFELNSAVDYGGAISASAGEDSLVDISRNKGQILFQQNDTTGRAENIYIAGGSGGAIFIGAAGSLVMNSNEGSVIFTKNKAAMDGGAICVGDNGRLEMTGNTGEIRFEHNKAGGNGGAISALDAVVALNNNSKVIFSDNLVFFQEVNPETADSRICYHVGGAIYGSNIQIHNNESVLFQRNAEIAADGSFRLRSLYADSLSGSTEVSLSAGENQAIEFHDGIYVGSNGSYKPVIHLNSIYNNLHQAGDIIFTGETTEKDLEIVKKAVFGQDAEIEITDAEILNSRTSTVLGYTYLFGGRLSVEKGAVFKSIGLELVRQSNATLRLEDATYVNLDTNGNIANNSNSDSNSANSTNSNLVIHESTTLEISGNSTIEGGKVIFYEGSNLNFVLSDKNLDNKAALAFNGSSIVALGTTLTVDVSNSKMDEKYCLCTGISSMEPYLNLNRIKVKGLNDAVGADLNDLVWHDGNLYYVRSMQWGNNQGTGVWNQLDKNWQEDDLAFFQDMNVKFTDTAAGEVKLSGMLHAGVIMVANSEGHDYTFSAAAEGDLLTGSIELFKRGTGTLILNLDNEFTGLTSLEGGTLNLHADEALGGSVLKAAEGTTLGVGNGAYVRLAKAGFNVAGNVVIDKGATLEIKGEGYAAAHSTIEGTLRFTYTASEVGNIEGNGAVVVDNSQITFKSMDSQDNKFKGVLTVSGRAASVSTTSNWQTAGHIDLQGGQLATGEELNILSGGKLSMSDGASITAPWGVCIYDGAELATGPVLEVPSFALNEALGISLAEFSELNRSVGGIIKNSQLRLCSGATLTLNQSHINMEGSKLFLDLQGGDKIKLVLTLDGTLMEDSSVILFSDVDALFGENYKRFDEGESFLAQQYFTGSMIGEDTMMQFQNGSLTVTGLVTPMVPEPTTATLSLLALAGLAARRRRK